MAGENRKTNPFQKKRDAETLDLPEENRLILAGLCEAVDDILEQLEEVKKQLEELKCQSK